MAAEERRGNGVWGGAAGLAEAGEAAKCQVMTGWTYALPKV